MNEQTFRQNNYNVNLYDGRSHISAHRMPRRRQKQWVDNLSLPASPMSLLTWLADFPTQPLSLPRISRGTAHVARGNGAQARSALPTKMLSAGQEPDTAFERHAVVITNHHVAIRCYRGSRVRRGQTYNNHLGATARPKPVEAILKNNALVG